MEETITIVTHIEKGRERQYFEIPFEVPAGVERLDIRYAYPRWRERPREDAAERQEINCIDLGLNAPDVGFLGASGSNRGHIWISAHDASDGFTATPVAAGTWSVIAGAYRVEEPGVDVCYDITLTFKERRLLKGDLHLHSTASDGKMTVRELQAEAGRMGLDFLCVSDHNTFSQPGAATSTAGAPTLIPGLELTHYKGHCNLLGAWRPIESPFCINTDEEMRGRLLEAKANGAMVSVNHPFLNPCPWEYDMEATPFDAVELWNGAILPAHNMACVEWWHRMLQKGRHIPVIGGSDFHFTEAFRSIAAPTTWTYAQSREAGDILEALRRGHSFLTAGHDGPTLSARAGTGILGDTVIGAETVTAEFTGLAEQDRIHIITDTAREIVSGEKGVSGRTLRIQAGDARFMRFELYRPASFLGEAFPWMISNPIYFREERPGGAH